MGGDLRLPLSPLRQQKGLRQMGGWQKPLAVLHPLPETPTGRLPWAVPAPARWSPHSNPVPRPDSLLRREHNPYPSFIPQSHQGPWKPPTTQGQTSQLLARPHSASRFPHAKLIKIGFLQSPSAHSKPHAPPHHSPPSEGGWKRRANRPTPTTRTGIPERGDKRAAEEGAVASSGEGSQLAGSRGGGAPAPATGLHSPQRCRTGSPQPSSATGPPAAPAASSPPAHRLHRLLPPHPPRGRPDSVAARAPRQRRRQQQ